jgi:hypothetical protein
MGTSVMQGWHLIKQVSLNWGLSLVDYLIIVVRNTLRSMVQLVEQSSTPYTDGKLDLIWLNSHSWSY